MTKKQQDPKETENFKKEEIAELHKDYSQPGGSIVRSQGPASGDFIVTNAAGEESHVEVKVKKVLSTEEKRKKFIDLSITRVNKAETAIRSIGNLSNRYAYDFDSKDVYRIIKHLREELNDVEARFNQALKKKGDFKL